MSEYTAFISYRHLELDMQVADRVHEMIERYRIPRGLRKNGQVHFKKAFRDQEELPLTSDLTRDIYHALDESEFLVVICTPDTPKSQWVTREIEYFISQHGWDRVLTVLAAGTTETSVPKPVTTRYAPDGVTILEEREPLSAMIVADTERERNRLLKKEFLRLAAAMLGCPYDSLVQRNKRYRMQLLAGAMGIVAAVALAFAGTVVSKNAEIQKYMTELEYTQSEALTKLSTYTIETGARAEAISYALQALPSADNPDRVYLPAAEKALSDALQIYEGTHMVKHALFPNFPRTVTVTEDGKYAIFQYNGSGIRETIDCYRLSDGACMWTRTIGEYAPYAGILFPDEDTVLVCHKLMDVYALSLTTGEVLRSGTWNEGELEGDLYPGEKMVIAGGWLPAGEDTVICHEDDTLYPDGVYFYNKRVNLMPGGTVCAMSVEAGQVCVFDVKSGKLVGSVDISDSLARQASGEYREVWQLGDHEGNLVLASIYSGCDGMLLRTYSPTGELLEEQSYTANHSIGKITELERFGSRLVFSGKEGLILMDLDARLGRSWLSGGDGYDFTIDAGGNMLLFDYVYYWQDPSWYTSGAYLQYPNGRIDQWYIPGDWLGDLNDLPETFALELPEYYGTNDGDFEGGYIFYRLSDDETGGMTDFCLLFMLVPEGRTLADEEHAQVGEEIRAARENGAMWEFSVGEVLYELESYGNACSVKNTQTGEIVARYNGLSLGVQAVTYHEDTDRLYIYDMLGMGTGVKIDPNNWEILAEIPRMFYFLKDSNELLCLLGQYEQEVYAGYTADQFIADEEGFGYRVYPVYSLEELVAMGNEILDQ